MKIRKASPEDYGEVKILEEQVFRIHRHARPDYFKAQEESYFREEFEELLASPCPISLVAVWEGAVVGICFGKIEETKENAFCKARKVAYIQDLVVLPEIRGKGVATALMSRARKQAVQEHAVSLELCVWNFNEQALRFYRNMGMEVQFLRMEEQLEVL